MTLFAILRMLLGGKKLTLQQFFMLYLVALVGLGLIYLGLTGRLHWLFALLGAVLPFVGRALPLGLRLINAIATLKWLKQFRRPGGIWGQRAAHQSTGQQSELKTRFLAMTLDHDSGEMNGRVLEGPFTGMRLSDMDLEQLVELHKLCREDQDSINVLEAYLDRVHPDWSAGEDLGGRDNEAPESGNVTQRQAWEILGLKPGADRRQVIEAHRRLMQRLHPDRGGSSYLAARINEAKRVLLGDKSKGSK